MYICTHVYIAQVHTLKQLSMLPDADLHLEVRRALLDNVYMYIYIYIYIYIYMYRETERMCNNTPSSSMLFGASP